MTGEPPPATSPGLPTFAPAALAARKFEIPSPRWAIAATFFAFGVASGSWSGSSAAILARAGVDAWAFGVALTCFTGAYLAAMSSGGVVARRFTVKRTLIAVLLTIGPVLAALLLASTAIGIFVPLIAYGLLAGMLDATMNAEGARIERRLGTPIFARLHGGASAGGAIGAILGSVLATSAAPWASGMIAEAGLAAAAVLVALAIEPDAGDRVGGPLPIRARILSRSLVVLGLTIGVSITCESATISWSALLLRREAPQWAAFAGLGAAFFFACQATFRVNADALRSHAADRTMMLLSFLVAAAGLGLVARPSRLRDERGRLCDRRRRDSRDRPLRVRAGGLATPRFRRRCDLGGCFLRRLPAAAGAARHRRHRERFFAFDGILLLGGAASRRVRSGARLHSGAASSGPDASRPFTAEASS